MWRNLKQWQVFILLAIAAVIFVLSFVVFGKIMCVIYWGCIVLGWLIYGLWTVAGVLTQ